MRWAREPLAVLCMVGLLSALCGCGSGMTSPEPTPQPPPEPTPSRIAFSERAGDGGQQIFTMYTNGTGVTQLTRGKSQGSNWDPSWSPDGRICFTSNHDGVSRLYVMNSDGSGQERLTRVDAGGEGSPDWCATGDRIVFSRLSGESLFLSDLYVMDLATRDEIQLTSDSEDFAPSWSPDGRFVAFTRGFWWPDPDTDICVVPAQAGQQASVLTDGWEPAWSPHGDRIAYACEPDPWYGHISYIPVNPNTGEASGDPVEFEGEPLGFAVAWSLDGQHIVFSTAGISKMALATGDVEVIRKTGSYADWSPILP